MISNQRKIKELNKEITDFLENLDKTKKNCLNKKKYKLLNEEHDKKN